MSLHGLFGLSQDEAYHSLWFVAFETFVLIFCIMILVEFAGRKTVSQMTMLQMVITIGIGEAVLMPILDKEFIFSKTIIIIVVLISFLILTEWLEIKMNWFERLFTRKSLIVVENGKLNVKNLKKLRLSVDQLEMLLRNTGIDSFDQLKVCTIESNGQLGYQLKEEEKTLTLKDFLMYTNNKYIHQTIHDDIFKEVVDDEHAKQTENKHPKNLR